MEYGRASSSIPHYLLPSTGSCHDICKYGRRLPLEQHHQHPTKPTHNTSAKSIPPKSKNPNICSSPQKARPSSPSQRWDGKGGRRNNNARTSVGNMKKVWIPVGVASGEGRKIGSEDLSSPPKDQKRAKTGSYVPPPDPSSSSRDDREITSGNEVDANPSSSSHGEENEAKLKLRIRNSFNHQENNVWRRHKFRSRVERGKSEDYPSNNIAIRIAALRSIHTKTPSKSRRGRVRYWKKRVLVLENRQGDRRGNEQENDNAVSLELVSKKKRLRRHDHRLQGERDAQVLLNCVIEETLSKLAERRKGTVRCLVGAFETLISLQARRCFFRVARVNC